MHSIYRVHSGETLPVKRQMFPLRQTSEIRDGDQWVCFKFISWAQNFAMSGKTAFVYVENVVFGTRMYLWSRYWWQFNH